MPCGSDPACSIRCGGVKAEPLGLIALSREGLREPLLPGEEPMFGAIIDQVAGALERLRPRTSAMQRGSRSRASGCAQLCSAPCRMISRRHWLHHGRDHGPAPEPDLYEAEAREELTAMIQDEAERMTSFVTNLLDMMRLEAGGIPLTLEPVDVGEVVARRFSGQPLCWQNTKVAVELAPDLPMLGLDAVLFEQVLVNLLDNAAKYTPPGSTITISGHQQQGGGVAIRVMDDGPGLPAESLERVFDKFYQAAGRSPAGRDGLGLAICRGFVEALGGSITAGNRQNRSGAEFTVVFPREMLAASLEREGAP